MVEEKEKATMIKDGLRTNNRTVSFEIYTHPDEQGRQTFMMHWWQKDFHAGPSWRGQIFTAKLEDIISRQVKHDPGLRINLVDAFGEL